jgi:lipopolysaccharide transport system permease protein
MTRKKKYFDQLLSTLELLPAAFYMAAHEIKLRYRKSLLGPFWLAISNAIYIVILGFLWSNLINNERQDFFKYFAISQLFWVWISSQITDSCELFIRNERLINQLNIPLQFYVLKDVLKNFFVFLHNLFTIVVIFLMYPDSPLYLIQLILFIPLAVILLFFMSSIIALACLRFRDLAPIITTSVQLLYFVTPIVWVESRIGGAHSWVYEINPMHHIISIIRGSFMGQLPNIFGVIYILILLVFAAIVSIYIFNRSSKKAYFWY